MKRNKGKQNVKKYINYKTQDIYAIVYRNYNVIYYNLNFKSDAKIIVYKNKCKNAR